MIRLCVLLFLLLHACSSSEGTPYFNQEHFRQKAELIMNQIPGWNVKLEATQSVEEKREHAYVEEQMAEKIVVHSFRDKDGTGVGIREMQYSNEMRAQMAFVSLQKRSKGGDELPGLTYTNDFLLKKSTSIYWLNTPCSYSWTNHTLLVEAFKSSFEDRMGKDTISCQCGFECD